MARKTQIYDDIPGTFVFDAERSRQGFGINMFCMSLMKDEGRKAFKADEAEYLKNFKLTPEQTEAILQRDYNRMLEFGGNIYFTAKLGATDGHSFQHLAALMTGNTQEGYAKMMLGGGRRWKATVHARVRTRRLVSFRRQAEESRQGQSQTEAQGQIEVQARRNLQSKDNKAKSKSAKRK